MALTPLVFRLLVEQAQRLAQRGCILMGGRRAICAGYPDLLVSSRQMQKILGLEFPPRADAKEIIHWHRAESWLDTVYDSDAVFSSLRFTLTVLDIAEVRGGEIIADLNEPLPEMIPYELVIDCGTCEHIFHAGRAMMNMASLVAKDGVIVQVMPLCAQNHGFWNASPTLVYDFYDQNGFLLLGVFELTGPMQFQQAHEPVMFSRTRPPAEDSWLLVIAERATMQELRPPMQRKYMLAPSLTGLTSGQVAQAEAALKARHPLNVLPHWPLSNDHARCAVQA